MKKKCKLLVSLMMALAMVVSTFAGAATQGTVAKAATTNPTTLTPAKVTDWFATGLTPATLTFTLPGGAVATDLEGTAVKVPVKMDYNGVMDLGITAKPTTGASVTAALYEDEQCAKKIGTDYTVDNASQKASWKSYSFPVAGTFYLKVQWKTAVPAQGTEITLGAYGYSGSEVTVGKDLQLVWTGNNSVNYHKIAVKSDGSLLLEGSAINPDTSALTALSFVLCDKNKKPLRTMSFDSSNKYGDYVALKKGTYYAAVSDDYPYMIRCVSSKVKDQSGASQKKAKLIKKGKTVKGLLGLSEGTSKADWFKVKLSKRTSLKLKYTALCTGNSTLKLQVIPANKKTRLTGATTIYMKSGTGSLSSKSLGKGTYYLKVSKSNKTDNGSYSIKYVK